MYVINPVIDVTDTQTPGYLRKQLGSTHAVSRPSAVWTKMELLIDRQRRVPAKSTQQKPSSPCGPPKGFDRTYRLHIPIRQHTVIDVKRTTM